MRVVGEDLSIGTSAASLSRISSTVMRVPRITGFPTMIAGLISIRSRGLGCLRFLGMAVRGERSGRAYHGGGGPTEGGHELEMHLMEPALAGSGLQWNRRGAPGGIL